MHRLAGRPAAALVARRVGPLGAHSSCATSFAGSSSGPARSVHVVRGASSARVPAAAVEARVVCGVTPDAVYVVVGAPLRGHAASSVRRASSISRASTRGAGTLLRSEYASPTSAIGASAVGVRGFGAGQLLGRWRCGGWAVDRVGHARGFAAAAGSGEGDGDDGEAVVVDDATKTVTPAGPGQSAPRPQHVIALPLRRRPLFPGFILPLTISDEKLMDTLLQLKKSSMPYVGVFMVNRDAPGAAGGDRDGEGARPIGVGGGHGHGHGSHGQGGAERGDETYLLSSMDDIHPVGSFAQIQHLAPVPGGVQAILMSHRRIMIEEAVEGTTPLAVRVSHIDEAPYGRRRDPRTDVEKAYANEILSTMREIIKINPMFKEHMQYFTQKLDVNNPYRLADFTASMTTADGEELQAVLAASNLEERLSRSLVLLKKERELSQLQMDISKDVEDKISKNQRQYFLHEQLKSIKKELGMEKDDKEALLAKFRERIEGLQLTEEAATAIDEEMDKLASLEKNSSEFNVTRTYLDWLTSLPWAHTSPENLDVAAARVVLDEDHYGMQDVKDRILEFIAVGALKGTVQGKIVCMVGPPGVGKTSIGKSIARSLGREFFRFSVGGLSDVAEIKGHRRTYVGAMPGKVIQCLKSTGVSNPLILIDEIDKLGRGYQGDPASALLELLDPNQNTSFVDHYLDVPVDCSKVLFIVTANVLDTIPGPLLDRMEVIRLSGYDSAEKVEIAKRYLEPKARIEAGLAPPPAEEEKETEADGKKGKGKKGKAEGTAAATLKAKASKAKKRVETDSEDDEEAPRVIDATIGDDAEAQGDGGASDDGEADAAAPKPLDITVPESLHLKDDAIEALIRWYCRESGVRNLEKHISKIYRKAAYKLVVASEEERVSKDWSIGEGELHDYVGRPLFTSDRMYESTPPGVTMGMAWTAMGGSVLYIEVTSPNYVHPAARKAGDSADSARGGAGDDDADSDGEGGGGGGKRGGGSGGLRVTGQMGDVMKESSQIAMSLARHKLRELDADNEFFEHASIHMHVPEGAVPKDGPSAGVTMVTSLLSLATNTPVAPDLSMTGEVSLTGRVLPVGGIKEKTMAARRSGVRTMVLPAGNEKEFEELPEHLKEGLTVHFAKLYDDVFAVAFPHGTGPEAAAAVAAAAAAAAAPGASA